VARQDLAVVGVDDLERVDLREVEAHRARIDDLDVGDGVLRVGVGPGDLLRTLGLPAEADVLGGYRPAVAPGGVGAQAEGEHLAIGRELVALGELGSEGRRVLGVVGLLAQQL